MSNKNSVCRYGASFPNRPIFPFPEDSASTGTPKETPYAVAYAAPFPQSGKDWTTMGWPTFPDPDVVAKPTVPEPKGPFTRPTGPAEPSVLIWTDNSPKLSVTDMYTVLKILVNIIQDRPVSKAVASQLLDKLLGE